jgi:FkbM family methyltransferase
MWLGSYEPTKMTAAAALLNSGDVAIDCGAHVGIWTLLLSCSVGPSGRVIAIEPSERNLRFLREHLKLNAVNNVTVIAAVASDREGFVYFDPSSHPSTGRVSPAGSIRVQAVTIDDTVTKLHIRPALVKVDVEGEELRVLLGAEQTIRKMSPRILLATHTPRLRQECTRQLEAWGYRMTLLASDDPDEWLGEPS